MKVAKISLFTLIVTAILGLSSGIVWALPSGQALFMETPAGGLWTYNYTLYNTSDPIADTGVNLYDFFLDVSSAAATLTNILAPTNWSFFSDPSNFVEWLSNAPGTPPIGSDLAPGTSLSGFSFTSDTRLASLLFSVYLVNPNEPNNPFFFNGTTAAIPEPATFPLLASGLVGVGFLKRRNFIRRSF